MAVDVTGCPDSMEPFWAVHAHIELSKSIFPPADYRNPFVEMHSEHPDIIYIMDDKKIVVVPCRVTSPDIKPKLTQVRGGFREAQFKVWAAKKVGGNTNLSM